MHMIPPAKALAHIHDKYWRLEVLHDYGNLTKSELKVLLACRENLKFKYGASTTELREASLRLQCGKTNYAACTEVELWKFVQDRKLLVVPDALKAAVTRDVLVNLLKAADDHATFAGYQSLPPELRERITKYYLREFGQALRFPTQPPLARASRLTRKEALPLFYQRCTFELHFETDPKIGSAGLKPCAKTLAWLFQLGSLNFSAIRNLEIGMGHHIDMCDRLPRYRMEVNFGVPYSRPKLKWLAVDSNRVPKKKSLNAQLNLAKVLHKIQTRDSGKLEMNDIYLFRKALTIGKKPRPAH